jgi:hypothetical protein
MCACDASPLHHDTTVQLNLRVFKVAPAAINPHPFACCPRLQAELDYYMFWATVYHSKLPYFKAQAKFIQDAIRIYEWKVGWQTETSIQVIKCYSAACRVEDCTFQLQAVVAPRLPSPGSQLGPDLKLRPAERSALVTAVGTPQTLKVSGHVEVASMCLWASFSSGPCCPMGLGGHIWHAAFPRERALWVCFSKLGRLAIGR